MPTLRILLVLLLLSRLATAQITQAPLPAATRLDSAAHARSVLAFQRDLNREFGDPKESPLTLPERQAFQALPYYPIGYGYYVVARLVRDFTAQPFAMRTSTDRRPPYRRYGTLHFTLRGQALTLSVYQSLELLSRPGLADYLIVPFTDLTNGNGSYGGGRYLDLRLPPAGSTTMLVDFNRAYNPSCAYNHAYSCPVPPAENQLPVAVPAGVSSAQ